MLSLDGILLANPWPARTKWAIFLGVLGIYLVGFRFLEQEVGPMAAIFVTLPVLFGAWLFGWRGGVGAGLASYPLNLVLMWVVMPGDLQAWAAQTGIIASSAAVLTGSIIGKMTDSRVQLAQELKALRRIQESQTLLTEQEEILAEIERIIHVAPEIEQVFEPLASQAGQLIPYDFLSITSTDLEAGTERRLFATGTVVPEGECGETAPLSNTLSGEVALTGATYTLDADSESEIPSRFPNLAASYRKGLRSFLAAPLISSDRVIGVIQFQACHPHAYQESHIELAKDVAYQISGAIANAQLDWERLQAETSLKESEECYRCLAEISRMASSSPNLSEALDNLVSAIAKLVPFDSLSISRVNLETGWSNTIYETWMDSASDARKSHSASKIPLFGTMTQEAAATRLPIRYAARSETEVASRYPRIHHLYQRGMRHFLAAPLISADAVVGVLHFAARENGAYTEDHLSLSQDIAAQIAGSIANSQLYADRLQTEEELNRSQERYRRLVENSPDAIVVTKMDEIIYINPSGTKLLGAVEDQSVIGKHYLDFVHPDFAAVATERMGMAQEEMEPIPLRHGKIVGFDGQVRDVEVSGTPLVQYGERTLQLTLRDITGRLQAEHQNLIMAELGRIISSSSDFGDVFEILGVEIEKLVPFDRMALIMVEANGDSATPTWIHGTDVPGRFPGDQVPMAGTTVEDIIRRKTTTILEAPTKHDLPDNFPGLAPSWLAGLRSFMGTPLIYRNEIIGVLQVRSKSLGVYSDREAALLERVATQISGAVANSILFKQREDAEAALIKSEAEHRALLENSPDLILRFDTEMRYIYANPAIEELTGFPPSAFIGKPHQEMGLPEKEVEHWQTYLAKAVRTGKPAIFNTEFTTDSGVRHFESNVVPEFNSAGEVQSVLVLARDVTARLEAEGQIKASLAEKELLLREINHRVKNNMQIVSSLLYLQSREVQDSEAIEVFEASQNRIKAMALVHEKLYRSADLAKIDFGDYIHSLTTDLYSSLGMGASGIGLTVDVDGVHLGIDAAIPCGLIVNELVSNSLKHAFPGQAEGDINIRLRTEGEQHIMVVKDNGIGFPPGMDVSQVKSLGLTIVKALATQLGGQVVLFSGCGAKTEINFPAN